MFPWRSSQCRHGSCAVDEKKSKIKPYCSVSICVGQFYLFCPHLGTRPWWTPLAPGRCLQWLDGGCSSVLAPANFLQEARNGGQLSCAFPPYDWRMRKVWDMWRKGEMCMWRKRRSHKRAEDGSCLWRFLLVIASPSSAALGGEIP